MKYRSVLFVPGHEEKNNKSIYFRCDLVVIDLESQFLNNEKKMPGKLLKIVM